MVLLRVEPLLDAFQFEVAFGVVCLVILNRFDLIIDDLFLAEDYSSRVLQIFVERLHGVLGL